MEYRSAALLTKDPIIEQFYTVAVNEKRSLNEDYMHNVVVKTKRTKETLFLTTCYFNAPFIDI